MNGFLLDTVVVSELRKAGRADAAVLAWDTAHRGAPMFLSVITLLEIRQGMARVKNRDRAFGEALEHWYTAKLIPAFSDRILPVDRAVAETAADFDTTRTLPCYDALLAATARVHGLVMVTRNEADFQELGLNLVNPWKGAI